MYFRLRWTLSLGLSPSALLLLILSRTRALRYSNRVHLSFISSSSLLASGSSPRACSGSGLPCLANDMLAEIPNARSFIRLRRPQAAYLGRRGTNDLLARAGDRHLGVLW